MASRSPRRFPPSPSGRRVRRGEAAGRALVSAWQASGLSQAAFARRARISAQRLGYWRLRVAGPAAPAASGFVEIPSAPAPRATGSGGVIVEVPGSLRVLVGPGFDPALLRSVVQALMAVAPC